MIDNQISLPESFFLNAVTTIGLILSLGCIHYQFTTLKLNQYVKAILIIITVYNAGKNQRKKSQNPVKSLHCRHLCFDANWSSSLFH